MHPAPGPVLYVVTSPARVRRWLELAEAERHAEAAHSRDVEDIWVEQDKLAELFSYRFELTGITGLEIGLLLRTLGERRNVYDIETLCHDGDVDGEPAGVCIDARALHLLAVAEFPDTAAREWAELIYESVGHIIDAERLELAIDRLQRGSVIAVERGEHLYSLPPPP